MSRPPSRRKYLQDHLLRLRLSVESLIRQAPTFDGDKELAQRIGIAMADLESAIAGEV